MIGVNQEFIELSKFAELFRNLDNFVICGHVSPDGDCVGSQLALWNALKALGKRATCVSASNDAPDPNLEFLEGYEQIIPAENYEGPIGAFIAVDVSDKGRMGAGAALLERAPVSFVLDHHANDELVATYEFIDADSPSASIIIWRVVEDLLENPPLASAECAYTGLLTDTGGFRFQNATPEAFKAAYELVSRGVNPNKVATEVFQNKSKATLLLEAKVLEHMDVFHHEQGILSYITAQDMHEADAKKSDAEPLIDVIRSLRGVRVACMLREQDGTVRGSLRAKDNTDVGSLARELGGGGHKAAAGFTLEVPLSEAVMFVRAKIDALLEETAS